MDAAEARRRRQERFKKGGSDRLAQITGKPKEVFEAEREQRAASLARASKSNLKAAAPDSDDPPLSVPTDPALTAIPSPFEQTFAEALEKDDLVVKQEHKDALKTEKRKTHWGLIHTLLMLLVGLYCSWNKYRLWHCFLAVELGLVATRYLLDPTMDPNWIVNLLQYVPQHIRSQAWPALYGFQALKGAVADFCVVLFVFSIFNSLA